PRRHLAHAAWFFPDHRQKIFRTLPITGNKYFVLYLRQPGFSGSQAKNISYPTDHRQKYFVLYLRWLEEENFLFQISCGGSVVGPTPDRAPAAKTAALASSSLSATPLFGPCTFAWTRDRPRALLRPLWRGRLVPTRG